MTDLFHHSSPETTASVTWWVSVLVAVAAVMLLATVFYPFGYDQAVFSTGGDMVLHGSVPYRDFLDTKPPLIFYLYALALFIFGHLEWSIHAFDIFWQAATSLYFFLILRRYLSKEVSLLSVSLTIILYAGSGFWMTAQAESFAILPSLLIVDMSLRAYRDPDRSGWYGLAAGCGAAILFLLKFTLVLGAVGAVGFALSNFRSKGRGMLSYAAGVFGSMLVVLAIAWVALWSAGASERFLESFGWLSNYASIGFPQFTIWQSLLLVFPLRIIYSLSFALFVFAVWAIVQWSRHKASIVPRSTLLRLLVFVFVAQLAGILLERKILFPYQYTRALWAIVPFSAIGALYWERNMVHFRDARETSFAIIFVLLALGSAPLYRIFTQTVPWTSIALQHEDPDHEVERRISNYFAGDAKLAAQYLNTKLSAKDRFFFWGNDVAIYFWADRQPTTICLTATPFRTPFTPADWKSTMLAQLQAAPPAFFVAEYGDSRPESTGSQLDSYQALLAWNGLESFLTAHYVADTAIGHFKIFRYEGH